MRNGMVQYMATVRVTGGYTLKRDSEGNEHYDPDPPRMVEVLITVDFPRVATHLASTAAANKLKRSLAVGGGVKVECLSITLENGQ